MPKGRGWKSEASEEEEELAKQMEKTKLQVAKAVAEYEKAEEIKAYEEQKRRDNEIMMIANNAALKEENEKLKRQIEDLKGQIDGLKAQNDQLLTGQNETNRQLAQLTEIMTVERQAKQPAKPGQEEKMDAETTNTKRGLRSSSESSGEDEDENRTQGPPNRKARRLALQKEAPENKEDRPPTKTQKPEATTRDEKPKETKNGQPPPIVLRQKENWTRLSEDMTRNGVKYTKARLVQDGVKIQLGTIDDYRKCIKHLEKNKLGYHTYSLQEEKLLHVVIRGIPGDTPPEEVEEDLRRQGIEAQKVTVMTSRRTKTKMPLFLVQLQKDQEKKIYNVQTCCYLRVTVEAQKAKTGPSQCFRCQKYGHAQGKCTAPYRCVKCGEGHSSDQCKRPREEPAKCANCEGEHPASYRGCRKYPAQSPRLQTQDQMNQEPKRTTQARQTTPGISYAKAAGGNKGQQPMTTQITMENMMTKMMEFQNMFLQMSALFNMNK